MVVFADPLSEFHLTTPLYTIGHSNHTWESFSPLLLDNEIELLVDVRSNPVSRFAPFANHRTLPDLLESVGIDHEFMGGPLGGKPADQDDVRLQRASLTTTRCGHRTSFRKP